MFDTSTIRLQLIEKSDLELRGWMANHYSQPKGFVGRQCVYKIRVGNVTYGAIAGGSTPKHLPGREDFFGSGIRLQTLVNNVFYHVERREGRYPVRNFTTTVVQLWRERMIADWPTFYGDRVGGFESLVEIPRTGELYIRDGWTHVGTTKGFTCKRIAGIGTDSYSGRRVWGNVLRPKLVFARKT